MFIKKIEELVVHATRILYTNMGSAATSTSNPLTEGTHLLRIKKDDAKLLQVFGDGIFSISIRQLGV